MSDERRGWSTGLMMVGVILAALSVPIAPAFAWMVVGDGHGHPQLEEIAFFAIWIGIPLLVLAVFLMLAKLFGPVLPTERPAARRDHRA